MKKPSEGKPLPRLPDNGRGVKVSKIEAAHRQLRTAIALWSADGDAVSIHTLAFAAYQIIHDLNRKAKGPPLLLDAARIRPEYKDALIRAIKESANFFKHADDRRGKKRTETASTTHLFY